MAQETTTATTPSVADECSEKLNPWLDRVCYCFAFSRHDSIANLMKATITADRVMGSSIDNAVFVHYKSLHSLTNGILSYFSYSLVWQLQQQLYETSGHTNELGFI
jgi:hypothetical protein